MDRKNSEDEKPSIIQEIVFYDKPNIKTPVPEEILPKSATIPLGKGDIVLSRFRKSSLSQTSLKNDKVRKYTGPRSSNRGLDASNENSPQNVKKTLVRDKSVSSEKVTVEKHSSESLNVEDKPLESIDSLNHFINYENVEEDPLVSEDVPSETNEASSEKGSVENTNINKKHNKNIENSTRPQKRASRSLKRPDTEKDVSTGNLQGKKNTKESSNVGKKVTETSEKESPFKTPKGPAKKAEKKVQKTTMLNFITKKSKVGSEPSEKIADPKEVGVNINKEDSTKTVKKAVKKSDKMTDSQKKHENFEEHNSEKNAEIKSSSKKNTTQKKARGRTRKSAAIESEIKSESYYSDEDVSFKSQEKNKNYTQLTNVPLDSTEDSGEINSEDLEELLDDTQEQVRTLGRVEEELQNMFKNGDGDDEKQTTKGKRKVSGRKTKSTEVDKNVKTEVEEVDDEESSRDPLDISMNDYDTDGDSRSEWVPLEYAEYRQQHIMRHQTKMYPCKFCGTKFPSYYAMRKHRALEHNDLGKDRKEGSYKESFKCKQEKELVDSDEESRGEWMPQEYAEYKIKHKMSKMKRVQWYKCKICCAVFSNYYKLSKHRAEHENKPNPYECKQCDARFKDVETLMAHIRIHQGKDPYQCKKCDRGFMTKAEMIEHMSVHVLKKGPAPVKRFRCDICSKEFSKLCDIERHTRVHTGEKPCECNICHKRFQQSHNLSKHLLTHLHVKPFQCEICNKKFGRIDVLNRHLLTHSMEKPFKCEICNKGFIRQVQLTNHIEKMHTSSDRGLVIVADNRSDDEVMEEDPIGNSTSEEFEGSMEEDEGCEEVIAM